MSEAPSKNISKISQGFYPGLVFPLVIFLIIYLVQYKENWICGLLKKHATISIAFQAIVTLCRSQFNFVPSLLPSEKGYGCTRGFDGYLLICVYSINFNCPLI